MLQGTVMRSVSGVKVQWKVAGGRGPFFLRFDETGYKMKRESAKFATFSRLPIVEFGGRLIPRRSEWSAFEA